MNSVTADNFGFLIAYLLPGLITLWAAKPFVPSLNAWLGTTSDQPSIGGFLYATVAAVGAGLLISTLRWLLIDTLHHRTGVAKPRWELRRLPETLAAFESLVQDHYRYYQSHSNGLVAVILAYASRLIATARLPGERLVEDGAVLIVVLILYLGSRDQLRKYYERTSALFEQTT